MCPSSDDVLAQARKEYLTELLDAGLLIPIGVKGVYGRSGVFENVIEHFQDYITAVGKPFNPEVIHFPPVISRSSYLCTDHIHNFPDLMGSLHSFEGNERAHLQLVQKKEDGEDWTTELNPTELMMAPAACYNLYPTATGILPENGRLVDLHGFVFRHEPSDDPARMQSFRMREYVRLGTPDEALQHRNDWIERVLEMLIAVGLDAKKEVANDPFFGRGGRVMKATQREQDLKYELVVPITSDEKTTAVASSNYHMDHFGSVFDIKTADGNVAHSACVGWGLERIALALFKKHGLDPLAWPSEVKQVLEL